MTSRTSASDSENSAFGISGFRTIGIPREQASVPKRPGAGDGWGGEPILEAAPAALDAPIPANPSSENARVAVLPKMRVAEGPWCPQSGRSLRQPITALSSMRPRFRKYASGKGAAAPVPSGRLAFEPAQRIFYEAVSGFREHRRRGHPLVAAMRRVGTRNFGRNGRSATPPLPLCAPFRKRNGFGYAHFRQNRRLAARVLGKLPYGIPVIKRL